MKKKTTNRGRRPASAHRVLKGRYSGRISGLVRGHHKAFRKGAGFFYQLVASLGDYSVFTMDAQGNISSWNSAAKAVFGFDEKEIIGRNFSNLFSEEDRNDGAPERELREAEKLGRAVDETWHIRKDGGKFWAAGAVFPLFDTTGALRGFTKIAQDLTPSKIKEDAAHSTSALVGMITDAIPALIGYIDPNQRYVFHNLAYKSWLGGDTRDLRGRRMADVFGSEAYRAVKPYLERALAGERVSFEMELPFEGNLRWVHIDYVPDMDPKGFLRGLMSLVTDITAAKRSEAALRKSEAELILAKEELEKQVEQRTARLTQVNEELTSFTYSASHDLRAPLRKVEGFAQAIALHAGDALDDEAKGYLARIREATKSMHRLIEDMLRLAGVIQRDLSHVEVDLSGAAAEIFAELQNADPNRSVEIRVQPGLRVRGDPELLRIALQNLLNNAWKFTRLAKPPRIEFGMMRDGKTYFVRDNGVGFDMRFAGKIFAPFERLHRMEDFPGTGVGLAIVKRAIQRHGGRVWAQSKPGEGASFFFTLNEGLRS